MPRMSTQHDSGRDKQSGRARTQTLRSRVRTRRCVALALPVAGVLITAVAGCGGSSSNGVASKTPKEILAASITAAQSATSVRVSSHNAQGPLTLTANLEFASNGGRAQVKLAGLSFEVIRIANTVYFKGSPAFDKRVGGTAAHLTPGTWLKAPVNNPQVAGLAVFTNQNVELKRLLTSSGPLTKGATTTINGQKALQLKQTAKLFTGSLYIATTGKPYPLQITKQGRETGQTTFTNWNQPITLTPPTNTTTVK